MIPYWSPGPLVAGGFWLPPQAAYLAAAVLAGHFLLILRAQVLRLPAGAAGGFSLALMSTGLAGSQAFSLVLGSHGQHFSLGLVTGALLGGLATLALQPPWEVFRLADAAAFIFPAPWLLVRFGCFLSHDHPGLPSRSWLAVRYPGGSRWDLALLEILFVLALFAAFRIFDRRRRAPGFFLGWAGLAFGIFRLAINPLRLPSLGIENQVDAAVAVSLAIAGLFVLTTSQDGQTGSKA